MKKTCTKCGGPGPFNRDKNRKDGLNPWCKACQNASTKAATNPEKHRQYSAAYRANNSGLVSKSNKKYLLKHKYGLEPSDVQHLLESQNGNCAICCRPLVRVNIDHNHLTGKVRGLLCYSCNIGLGLFLDSPDILLRARDYLIGSD